MFNKAIVCIPSDNFANGLTGVDLGKPDLALVMQQHNAYCTALQGCGLELFVLPVDERYPDSTFVEDTTILTERCAILTNPGAKSRKGEVAVMRPHLEQFFEKIFQIKSPGTLDGGDICEADDHFFIGLSERTNEEGARQLGEFLAKEGYTSSTIDVHGIPDILHLKSGLSYLGDNNLVAIDAFAEHPDLQRFNILRVDPRENYAANCVRVNDYVLLPAGYPELAETIQDKGYSLIPLNMSEFAKMDGGLSCLSLRFC